MFSTFAKWVSKVLGKSISFTLALLFIITWAVLGPYFKYDESWQLFVNTGTTIITFLMVFLIQHTQNRDTTALQLKLDELIRSIKGAHNELVKIEELSDEELEDLHKRYEALASKVKKSSLKAKDNNILDV